MKTVKRIRIELDKCSGCGACEMICSSFHAQGKHSLGNPERSRIRVYYDEENDVYVPVIASAYLKAECIGRNLYKIHGKDYGECVFCGVSCPSRELFKEPDCGLPLKCDMCEDDPPQKEPLCVQWCLPKALTYEEREEEVEEEVKPEDVEIGLESMVDKYGFQKVMDTVARMAKKE